MSALAPVYLDRIAEWTNALSIGKKEIRDQSMLFSDRLITKSTRNKGSFESDSRTTRQATFRPILSSLFLLTFFSSNERDFDFWQQNKSPVKIHGGNLITKVRDTFFTVPILQIFQESRLNFASWIRNRDQLFPSSYYLFGSPGQVLHGFWTVKVNSEEEEEKARFSILALPFPHLPLFLRENLVGRYT